MSKNEPTHRELLQDLRRKRVTGIHIIDDHDRQVLINITNHKSEGKAGLFHQATRMYIEALSRVDSDIRKTCEAKLLIHVKHEDVSAGEKNRENNFVEITAPPLLNKLRWMLKREEREIIDLIQADLEQDAQEMLASGYGRRAVRTMLWARVLKEVIQFSMGWVKSTFYRTPSVEKFKT